MLSRSAPAFFVEDQLMGTAETDPLSKNDELNGDEEDWIETDTFRGLLQPETPPPESLNRCGDEEQ